MARTAVIKLPIDAVLLALWPTAEVPPRSLGYSKLRCPAHDDVNASASINWDSESFKCFSCDNIRGDGIDLIMAVRGVDFASANAWAKEEVDSSGQDVQRPARRRRTSLF